MDKHSILAIAGFFGIGAGQAALLVYEPFDYEVVFDPVEGALEGKDGGLGFAGPWEDMIAGSNAGIPFVYGSEGNTEGSNGAKPDWDGVFEGVPQAGGYVGLSPFSSDQFEDRINARRLLAKSAGEMAGADGILWMSMIVHFEDTRFNFSPGLMLTTGGGFSERVRDITDNSTGIGIGHGSSWGIDLNAITYNEGIFDTRTNVSDLSTALDNMVILKFEFGDEADKVSTWFFTEGQEMTEEAFDLNAGFTTSTFNIDEDQLLTLAVGFTRAGNAYDEIRIGDTFADVISGSLEEPSVLTLAISPSAGNFDFMWPSREGKVYDLLSSVDLAIPAENWGVWNGQEGLAATPPMNSLPEVVSGDPKRFFVIRERNASPPGE